jgi:TRAP-type C4-dicarboxylate transport system substrate-binding protein
MKKRTILIMAVCLAFFSTLILTQGNALAASKENPIVLKLVRAWPKTTVMYDTLWEFVKRVETKSKGSLIIKDVGGSEVSPAFEQLGMLKAGLADLVITVPAYVAGDLPESNAFYFNFGADLVQLRAAGVFDRLSEIAREKTGSIILGGYFFSDFNVYLTKKVKTINDFRGLKLRSLSMYDPILQGLGAATVTIAPAEVYTALERGVVDGLGWPDVGLVDFGFHEILKYVVLPSFWRYPSGFVLMRAKAYDGLPDDLKKILTDTMVEIEKETPAVFNKNALKDAEAMKRAGMQTIMLSEEDWRKTQQRHWEQGVKNLLLGPCPKYGQELMELMSQFYPPKDLYVD